MERELEQMLQASCGKSITEASNEEMSCSSFNIVEREDAGNETQRGRQKIILYLQSF